MSRETSSFGLRELKFASGSARTFTGYGAVFDNVDSYGDAIQRGAFRRSLDAHRKAGTMPAMLSQHGSPFGSGGDLMPIGTWLSLEEDDYGLAVEGRLSDTPRGNEAYQLLKDGALTGLSIGFVTRAATPGTGAGEPKRTLTEIDLWEVSLVTFPANGLARVDGVKLADGRAFSIRDCERALRDAGLPRELAKAVTAHGWRAATERRDGAAQANALLDALKTGATELQKAINSQKD
jgi:uncharacterized protein